MTILYLMIAAGVLAPVLFASLASARLRVPTAAWLVLPVAVAVAGCTISWLGLETALSGISSASPEMTPILAEAGITSSLDASLWGWWAASGLALWAAMLAALTTLFGEREDRWSFRTAGIVACLSILGFGGVFVEMLVEGMLPAIVPLVGLVAGLAVAVSTLRRSEEAAVRRAQARATVATTGLFATLAAAIGMGALQNYQAAMAMAKASWETRQHFTAIGFEIVQEVHWSGGVSVALLVVIGGLSLAPVVRHFSSWRIPLGVGIAAVLLTAGPWVLHQSALGGLQDVANQLLGERPSAHLQIPKVEAVAPARLQFVGLVLSSRHIAVHGNWLVDLDQSELPPDFVDKLPGAEERMRQLRGGRTTIMVQADKGLGLDVVGPMVEAARNAGYSRVELIAVSDTEVGVVELGAVPAAADLSLQAWLTR